jgi:uncharacterized protein YbjQ (UPF0145 family)
LIRGLAVLIVTTNDLPGWEIQRVCGEVFGLTVRSRNAFSQFGAGLKSTFGGELQGMTKNLAESRNEAMGRLITEARNRGGNAVVAMRFDTTEIGEVWTEICAYGTAVQGSADHRCREVHGESARLRGRAAAAMNCLINRRVRGLD